MYMLHAYLVKCLLQQLFVVAEPSASVALSQTLVHAQLVLFELDIVYAIEDTQVTRARCVRCRTVRTTRRQPGIVNALEVVDAHVERLTVAPGQ